MYVYILYICIIYIICHIIQITLYYIIYIFLYLRKFGYLYEVSKSFLKIKLSLFWNTEQIVCRYQNLFKASDKARANYNFSDKVLWYLLLHHIAITFKCCKTVIVWKVSKYGFFSGPYFSVFGLNTEIYY